MSLFPLQLVYVCDDIRTIERDFIHEGLTLEDVLAEMPDLQLAIAIVVNVEPLPGDNGAFITLEMKDDVYESHDSLVIPLSFSDIKELLP